MAVVKVNFIQDPNSALLTENLCSAFEQDKRLTLPDDYKHFLCNKMNGGRLACKESSVPLRNENETPINKFLGIGAHDNLNMDEKIWILGKEDLPVSMIPIADDPGGNFFFLEASGKNAGKVYFYDHEEEPNDPPTADNNPSLTLIANSFSEFLDSIECIGST